MFLRYDFQSFVLTLLWPVFSLMGKQLTEAQKLADWKPEDHMRWLIKSTIKANKIFFFAVFLC